MCKYGGHEDDELCLGERVNNNDYVCRQLQSSKIENQMGEENERERGEREGERERERVRAI